MRKISPLSNGLMAALFIFAAVLQYNDPDPLRWMALYLSAAIACFLRLTGRSAWLAPGLVGLTALVWTGTIAPRVAGRVPFFRLFARWEMANPLVEEGREMYGLLIVAGWMAFLVATGLKKRSPSLEN